MSKIRINYQYKEYKDYPEATAISESRERNRVFIGMFCILGIALSFIFLLLDWSAIFLAIFCGVVLVYLKRYYDTVTQKKIAKAIADRDKMMDEINNPTYDCQAIKIVMKRPAGKCSMCHIPDVELFLCDIKRSKKSTSVIPVCNSCINRFKANIK